MLHIETVIVGMIETNCYIVYPDEMKNCVIIDPGGNASKLIARIEALGLEPEAVLLTHGHFDHILAVDGLIRHFPGLKLYACAKEGVLLEDASLNASVKYTDPVVIKDYIPLNDGEEIRLAGTDWKLIHTPGHTVGSSCYYVDSAGVLFSGDTLFQQSFGRTDFATGNTRDMINSIGGKLMELPDETIVYPGHGPATDIGFERSHNMCVVLYKRTCGNA